jgi:hypothetical protein
MIIFQKFKWIHGYLLKIVFKIANALELASTLNRRTKISRERSLPLRGQKRFPTACAKNSLIRRRSGNWRAKSAGTRLALRFEEPEARVGKEKWRT